MSTLTNNQSYRQAQFRQLALKKAMDTKPTIRIETEHGETKRLNITVEEAEAITAILMIDQGEN